VRTKSILVASLTFGLSVIGCAAGEGDLAPGPTTPGAGGASSTGGTTGNAMTGGAAPTGGLAATGGAATGGVTQGKGGAATGGAPQATGGASPATGGASATGGKSGTGGAAATGGARQTGGAATSTGGKGATGGAAATGGANTAGGATAAGGGASLPKFVGNISTGNAVDSGTLKYSKYWDQITPENAGKWGSVQGSTTSAFNWASLDSFYQYAQTNNIIFKQHVFVWGSQQPSGTPTLAQVETWIKTFCTRYPNTKVIDVVNEPPPHTTPNYTANLGAGEGGTYAWITKAFKLSRQYCGSAVLVLNDYNNLEYASQEQHFIDIVKDIKANGAPIDAVGCQGHALKGMSTATLQTNVNKMATDTGLPVYITEYDIGDASDATQLTNFQNHFSVFLNTSSIKGITVWGWINGRTWISNSGIVNGTTPRSAMTWLMGQLNRPVPPN